MPPMEPADRQCDLERNAGDLVKAHSDWFMAQATDHALWMLEMVHTHDGCVCRPEEPSMLCQIIAMLRARLNRLPWVCQFAYPAKTTFREADYRDFGE